VRANRAKEKKKQSWRRKKSNSLEYLIPRAKLSEKGRSPGKGQWGGRYGREGTDEPITRRKGQTEHVNRVRTVGGGKTHKEDFPPKGNKEARPP